MTQAASAKFAYPKSPTTTVQSGRENVNKDLIRLRESEIAEARKAVSNHLRDEERDAAIAFRLREENLKLLKQMNDFKLQKPANKSFTQAISKEQAQKILDTLEKHPVVGDQASLKYETKMRQIGYCFGKAFFVHLELLRRGVDSKSIGKVFVVGPLIYGDQGWDFHVTTVVKATDSGWWAIDGLDREATRLEDWIKKVESWSPKPSPLSLYFSDAVKLNPTPGAYSDQSIFAPHYHGLFRDVLAWFAKPSHLHRAQAIKSVSLFKLNPDTTGFLPRP